MTERSPAVTIALIVASCGIYWFYWIYVTTKETSEALGRSDLNATQALLFSVFTCGLVGTYFECHNAGAINAWFGEQGIEHKDVSYTMLYLSAALVLTCGISKLAALWLLQEEYNALARAQASRPAG